MAVPLRAHLNADIYFKNTHQRFLKLILLFKTKTTKTMTKMAGCISFKISLSLPKCKSEYNKHVNQESYRMKNVQENIDWEK